MTTTDKTLIVITGPTGIGKSDVAIELSKRLSTEIISADSRQFFKEIPITTAAPTESDLSEAKHHLVGMLNLSDYYSASTFEEDALKIISQIFEKSQYAIMCGGSMMYIDAVCKGIDDIPTIADDIRNELMEEHSKKGDVWLLDELLKYDPEYYAQVDKKNIKRVFHAIEIYRTSGRPYSHFRTGNIKKRPFNILKIGLTAPREIIFDRINRRVIKMMENGMLEEAQRVIKFRNYNSLNTVGFKEIFKYLDGDWDLPTAIARIQKNTRVYAKKQLTWYQKDPAIRWIDITTSKPICDRIIELL